MDRDTLKERIRSLLLEKNMTFEELATKLEANSRAMHNRLGRDTSIKYKEIEKILNTLDYDIIWQKRDELNQ